MLTILKRPVSVIFSSTPNFDILDNQKEPFWKFVFTSKFFPYQSNLDKPVQFTINLSNGSLICENW